jgi:uncharacterized protein (TIGR00369 family)
VTAATGPCGQDDRYAAHLGIEPLSADATTAQAAMTLGEQHLNDIGRAHGGALFSLAATCEDDVVAVGSGETLVIPIEDPA